MNGPRRRGQGLYRPVLPSPQPHVLRPLGTNCGPEGVAFVWQVKEHSLLATESFVTCGHCSTFSVPTGNLPLCFISEYKVSFHRQPLKQKVCLLFQGNFLKKKNSSERSDSDKHVLCCSFLSYSHIREIANVREREFKGLRSWQRETQAWSLAGEPDPEVHNTVQSASLLVGGGEGAARGPFPLV